MNGDNKEEKKEEGAEEPGEVIEEDEAVFYDKTKSFFDNISCEATERAKGYVLCLCLKLLSESV